MCIQSITTHFGLICLLHLFVECCCCGTLGLAWITNHCKAGLCYHKILYFAIMSGWVAVSHPFRQFRNLTNNPKQGFGKNCLVALSNVSYGGQKSFSTFIKHDFALNDKRKLFKCFPSTHWLSEHGKCASCNFHTISSRRRGSSKRSNEESDTAKGKAALTGLQPAVADSYWAKPVDHLYDSAIVDEWKLYFANLQQYDHEDLLEWRRAFDVFDRDDDGFISQADLQKTPNFSLDKSRQLKKYDRDQNNLIDFGEFVEAMFNVDIKTLKDNFEGFDSVDIQLEFEKHAETNPVTSLKTLSFEHLKEMMEEYQFTCVTKTDAKRLFDCMDSNKDGNIDFEDFKNWLCLDA
ncbi:protein kinase [Cardiosporidium cionae]|uniref:Protein kinase n=1 Tax=Cardiosporidium cionae TaxID=476202 RepID=A0ABQ7J9E2_9APIC|nr:protein kinase [Cardiosporidium cionae]|eukprot:KAF8820578.1 protein kinase [Cardiosporidium cionae]